MKVLISWHQLSKTGFRCSSGTTIHRSRRARTMWSANL